MLRNKSLVAVLTAGILLAAGALTAQKRQVMLDRVVAVVGGSAILYSKWRITPINSSSIGARRGSPPTAIR